ncbi:MAG TPA: OB-fold nucleic acid binding domain-containing protein, partial [Clostridia bacterium]|nr:OB-fold nucleic acid binding domain-containing protein [Clostridia bacterium]
VIGFYLTGHPLAAYRDYIRQKRLVSVRDILSSSGANRYGDGKTAEILGMIQAKQLKSTRSGKTMAFLTLDDGSGSIEIVVFPPALERFRSVLNVDDVVQIKGKISVREDEAPKLLCDEALTPDLRFSEQKGGKKTVREGLYLRVPSKDGPEYRKAENLVSIFDGDFPLYILFRDRQKLALAPKRMWVSLNNVLLSELKAVLGEENVRVRR